MYVDGDKARVPFRYVQNERGATGKASYPRTLSERQMGISYLMLWITPRALCSFTWRPGTKIHM